MSQTKAQLISDLVQALNFTGTSSAPANGVYLSAANTIKLATNSNPRLTIDSSGNATFTGTCTATTFIGALTGNASGSAATVTGAAQTAITSVGTLTSLQVVGDVGLGVAPAAFGSGVKTIVLQGGSSTKSGCIDFKENTSGTRLGNIFVQNDATYGMSIGTQCSGEAGDFIRFHTGALASTKMLINANGHVGIGVTPSAWPTNADSKALQIGTGFAAFGRGSGDEDRGGIAVNYYTNGTENKYIANGHSNRVYMNDGNIDFQWAPSGNAGNDITFTSGIRMKADGKVGIGTTSPSCKLNVVGASGTDPTVQINHSEADVQGEFLRVARTDLPTIRYHSLVAQHGGAAANNFIGFKLHTGSTTTSQSDVLRIRGNGRVGINTNDPTAALYIDTSHYVVTDSGQSTTGIHLDGTTGNAGEYGGGISFGCGTSGSAAIAARQCTSDGDVVGLSFFTHDSGTGSADAVEKVRIMDGGVTCFNNGIGLGNGLTVAASNTLDDYEEGTFTPNILVNYSTTDVTQPGTRNGTYTKIGNRVLFGLHITGTFSYSGSNHNVIIGNLPFTANGNSSHLLALYVWAYAGISNGEHLIARIKTGNTSAYIQRTNPGASVYVNECNTTNWNFMMGGHYTI
jgi:hypothetical protein